MRKASRLAVVLNRIARFATQEPVTNSKKRWGREVWAPEGTAAQAPG